jgi:hypothetical protein
MVIAPANTGNDNTYNQAVIKIAHTNKGNLSNVKPGALILIIVTIRLIAIFSYCSYELNNLYLYQINFI